MEFKGESVKALQIEKYLYDDDNAYWYNNQGEKMCQSVHGHSYTRLDKAKEQASKEKVDKKVIEDYVKEFLKVNNISTVDNATFNYPSEVNYSDIKNKYNLKDERDIVWMKFTKDGFLGVVAKSNDINFDMPPSSDEYDEIVLKRNKYNNKEEKVWKWNSSGILVHKLGKEWEESFVLIFPLSCIPDGYDRGDIEKAIGNYLITKGVPIIDYFSHMYK